MPANSLFELSKERMRQLWVLTDAPLVNENWQNRTFPWFVVLGASPAKVRLSRQWEKDRNVGVRYISPWDWDEIYAAYRY